MFWTYLYPCIEFCVVIIVATFSVIIPVYNIENFLCQCLDSVLAQTFTDLEIILVNDGSTDNCPAICDNYAASDSRIQVIHKKNGGSCSARKAGAKIATADYVACVDGDDWIELDYFKRFASVVERYLPDIVCCGIIAQSRNFNKRYQKLKEQYGYYNKKDITEMIFPNLISFNGGIGGKVFKRHAFLDVQLGVDERIKIGEDACVVIPCIYKAESMYILEECLYNYRYNPSSMTRSKSVYNLKEPKMIACHLEKHLDLELNTFRQQLYISTVHRLFNRCVSQFSQQRLYDEICIDLNRCLDDNYYQECINKCTISLTCSPKKWFAYQVLKRRWYRLLEIYNRVR